MRQCCSISIMRMYQTMLHTSIMRMYETMLQYQYNEKVSDNVAISV